MLHAPDSGDDEQKWLTRYLRKLIEKNGWEHFVAAPIVEPTRRYFPEGWDGTGRDVHIVTQRLMHFAGLGDLRVHMTSYGQSEYGHIAGWFTGIEDGRCTFGVAVSQLRDPEAAAGVMAHEVAHAWRHHHDVVADSRDREELLTDLTTIYLGFGILTTNNTDRYRSSGTSRETRWSMSSVGYLPPDSMSFLLAMQAKARGRRSEIRTIEKHLEPNQQACFAESLKALADVDLLELLQLPPRETWPEPRDEPAIEIDAPEDHEVVEPPKPVVNNDPNPECGCSRIRKANVPTFSRGDPRAHPRYVRRRCARAGLFKEFQRRCVVGRERSGGDIGNCGDVRAREDCVYCMRSEAAARLGDMSRLRRDDPRAPH